MIQTLWPRSLGICLSLAIGGIATLPMASSPAQAQATANPVLGAETDIYTATERAKITAIDQATRVVTLQFADRSTTTVKVGEAVRNLGQVKVGDEVVAELEHAVTYALLKAGTKQPSVVVTEAVGRTKPGERPGAAGARSVGLTVLIVGVNVANNTLDVVPQSGGSIRTLTVRNKERQAYLKQIQPGQLLSVVVTNSVAVSVLPSGG